MLCFRLGGKFDLQTLFTNQIHDVLHNFIPILRSWMWIAYRKTTHFPKPEKSSIPQKLVVKLAASFNLIV